MGIIFSSLNLLGIQLYLLWSHGIVLSTFQYWFPNKKTKETSILITTILLFKQSTYPTPQIKRYNHAIMKGKKGRARKEEEEEEEKKTTIHLVHNLGLKSVFSSNSPNFGYFTPKKFSDLVSRVGPIFLLDPTLDTSLSPTSRNCYHVILGI